MAVCFCFVSLIIMGLKITHYADSNYSFFSNAAACLIMPVGAKSYICENFKYEYINGEVFKLEYSDKSELENKEKIIPTEESAAAGETNRPTADSDGQPRYSIIEKQITGNGTFYENFWVKNSTSIDINIPDLLSKRPDAVIELNKDVQVLIVHTHTSESYIDKDLGYYPADFYPRCTDPDYNVVAVGEAIKTQLENAGIKTLHDTTVHDNPTYNGAYSRTAQTIINNLQNHPSLKVVLDIHRDSIGNDESGRVKPTFTYNGKKAAQVMIISGCDEGGSWYFPEWEYNLRLALRIQQMGEKMYPGLMRPLNFSVSEYNMSITRNSLLLEVGSDVNTFDEAVYSGELLGKVLSEVLLDLTE